MHDRRKVFVVLIAVFVGALHFVSGPGYKGPCRAFVNGHLIDVLLPFVVYFLIALPEVVRKRWLIALITFSIGFIVETMQYFRIPLFGQTFDPLDYAMYLLGVFMAVVVDVFFFSKLKAHDKKNY